LVWRLEALAFDAVTFLARLFPIDAVSDFGAAVAGVLGPLTSTHRVAETNIRIAFPDLPEAQVEALLKSQWRALGRWAAEFPILDKIIADPARVEVVNAERLAAITHRKESVVFISGHFSSMTLGLPVRSPIAPPTTRTWMRASVRAVSAMESDSSPPRGETAPAS